MLVVGLTGNVASGKSEVASELARLGATLVDADQLARLAVAPGTPALAAIEKRWGPAILTADGTLDRGALRRIVMADPAKRRTLEGIVHPEVKRMREELVAQARDRGDRLVICDIPLLFEAGLEHAVDRIVVVDASPALRRDRLLRLRHLDPADADALIAAQQHSATYRGKAHDVIENNGTLALLRDKARALYADLDALARSA